MPEESNPMDNEQWRRPNDSPIHGLDRNRKKSGSSPYPRILPRALNDSQWSSGYADEQNENFYVISEEIGANLADELEEIRKRCSTFGQRIEILERKLYEQTSADKRQSFANDSRRLSLFDQSGRWKDELADKTTIHGLKEVLTEDHKFLRPTWLLIFLMAVGCTGYYVWNVVGEYREDPTATKVRIMRQDDYQYPVMLVCPDTWLHAEKALALNISEAALQYALGFLINFGVNRPPYKIQDYDRAKRQFEDWWYAEENKFVNLDEFFKYIAVDADKFKRECSYCDNPQIESSDLFAKVTMNEGVCYNISMPPINGRVALGDLDYLHIEMPQLSGGYLSQKSYWKYIVNPDQSLGMSDTHYLQVFPNHSNTIRVMLHHFISLPNAYCITRGEAESKNYTQSSCIANCFVTSKSRCHPLPMIRKDAIPKNVSNVCNTAQQVALNWVEPTSATSNQSVEEPQIEDIPPGCVESCPSLCEKWVYESSVEAHLSPEEEEGMTSFHFLNQVIHYGGILSHEEVLTYSFETLVSNVGGQMGLWLGASLMSLIELIMFLLNFCFESKKR